MIISQIAGGLGNQMFQYALGRSIALRTKEELKLDISGLTGSGSDLRNTPRTFALDSCNVRIRLADAGECDCLKYRCAPAHRKLWSALRRRPQPYGAFCYRERGRRFNPKILEVTGDAYLIGYWQSYKYFIDFDSQLREEFTPRNPISARTSNYESIIAKTNAVSVHVRRGDYISNATANAFHGTCNVQYYRDAIRAIGERVKNPRYFVFSDDLEWSRSHLDFVHPVTFVEYAGLSREIEDIYLMRKCRHNIIANSTFSWWGAWLNEHPNRIAVTPKRWFRDPRIETRDMIPPDWLTL